ncbi:Uncharacterized protein DBV15_01240, partial [Temnothorax longispinosus]
KGERRGGGWKTEGAEERAPRARERDGYADTDPSCRWPLRQICGSPRPIVERRGKRVIESGSGHPAWIWVPAALLAIVRSVSPGVFLSSRSKTPFPPGCRGMMRCSDDGAISARSLSRPSRSPSAEIEFDQSDLCGRPLSPWFRRHGD